MYPEKALTDATFRQTYVKLSRAEREDDTDVVDILDHCMKTSGLDAGTQGTKAYKLDEAVEWAKWIEEVDLAMSALTGPEALSISVAVSIWVP